MKVLPPGLFGFGALHGYLPKEKRSREDFWKAYGVGFTGVFLYSLPTIEKPRYSLVGSVIGSAIAPGLYICTGMIVGKAAAAANKHNEDS